MGEGTAAGSRLEGLLAQLSPAEKLGLLSGGTPFWAGMLAIVRDDASHQRPWPAGAVPRLGLSGLQFVDGPRGIVLRGGATTFPAPITRGASWDPELEARVGAAIAREGRSFGANWFAVVCVNLLRHPGWGRAQETYGEDPLHVGAMGAAMTRGVQRHGLACIKHYALNSIDRSRFVVDVQITPRVLHELYLPQFKACIDAGAASVMSAYNRVNGQWCSQNPELLTVILRERWGFEGFVVSDFIFGVRDGPAALLAGLDLEMPFAMVLAGTLPEALSQGRISPARIDAAAGRLLRAQLTIPAGDYPMSLRGCPEHRALAREAATKAIVLLRNEPAHDGTAPLLPLEGLQTLAVLGPLAAAINLGDRGSSDTRPEPGAVITPLAGLQQAAPGLTIRHHDGRSAAAAAAVAAGCEAAVLVLGLDWRLEGEHIHPGDIAPVLHHTPPPQALTRWLPQGLVRQLWAPLAGGLAWLTSFGSARPGSAFAAGDRTDLELPARQQQLIEAVVAANPRTVVVLMGGGAILCERWRARVPAIVLLGYPGEQGGAALADVLLGRVSPSGRLPFAIPTSAAHLPPFDPMARRVRYDLWHGYRRLQHQGRQAAFPFGFGLSYSPVSSSDLQLSLQADEQLQVHVRLSNNGSLDTDTVLQIYGEPPGQQIERPHRLLIGFQRLHLNAGESRLAVVTIALRQLAFFDGEDDCWRLEAGVHRVVVAHHAEDPGLTADVELAAVSWANGPVPHAATARA
jgi:beta-glucosidase